MAPFGIAADTSFPSVALLVSIWSALATVSCLQTSVPYRECKSALRFLVINSTPLAALPRVMMTCSAQPLRGQARNQGCIQVDRHVPGPSEVLLGGPWPGQIKVWFAILVLEIEHSFHGRRKKNQCRLRKQHLLWGILIN